MKKWEIIQQLCKQGLTYEAAEEIAERRLAKAKPRWAKPAPKQK